MDTVQQGEDRLMRQCLQVVSVIFDLGFLDLEICWLNEIKMWIKTTL